MAKRKRQKPEEKPPATTTMNIDRISKLPDSVLCHVLSFLPTQTSVATSILSRRWRHLWKHLEVLDLDYCCFDHLLGDEEAASTRFVPFVNAVLALRRVRHIKKFRLSCDASHHIMDDVTTWVRAPIGPHLQELDLSLPCVCAVEYQLPRSIFTCPALVSLSLVGGFRLEHLSSVHLPSLKNLTIDGVLPIADLLSGCPVLETLDFYSGNDYASRFCIFSSSLKSLKFQHYAKVAIESLEIHTPSLEYLDIVDRNTRNRFSVCDLHNVVEARLSLHYEVLHVGFLQEVLWALRRTKILKFYSPTKCLLHAPPLDFPKFCCLIHLEIDTPCFTSRFVMDLLHNCNMLQVLQICQERGLRASDWTQSIEPCWTQPTNVPNCVISHLTTVRFRGYQHTEDEHAFTANILHRGLVLRTLIIHTDSSVDEKKKYHILKGLSEMPRGSNLCQLKFD